MVTKDEQILRQNLEDYWRCILEKYDLNGDGYINVKELDNIIRSQHYEHDIPSHVVEKIYSVADTNHDGLLEFNEFVTMVTDPILRPLFRNMINKYVQMIVPIKSTRFRNKRRGQYEDEFRYCPPPIVMIIISLIEIIFYVIDTNNSMGPVSTAFIYDPSKRYEAWRYVTYTFVHIGVMHLVVNVCVQVLLGTPLEMGHRWWRVLIIYFAGVLAGSLGTSVVDPTVKLAGASGGVYALITANIATVIMNWKEMEYPTAQMLIFLIVTLCDIGSSVYDRYVLHVNEHVSCTAHFAGAVAGLLVGINVVRNMKITHTENIIWWMSIFTYILLMGIAIVWNIAYTEYFLL